MARFKAGRWVPILAVGAVLSGCSDGGFFAQGASPEANRRAADTSSVRLVDRDVEAPEVFQVSEAGLWDGRPSLGGVWVAYPDVTEPERVIIRNTETDKFVIGALFRRERDNPGPKLQVSSDAAAALGMLAGAPAALNVTALRRQEVPISNETGAEMSEAETEALEAPAEIETASLDDPVATAEAALAAANSVPEAKPTSTLDKPFVQIGLFSVEANANRTGERLREAGVTPTIRREESRGKEYFRVVAGPAGTTAERSALLAKVKGLGFADAYLVAR